MNVDALWKVLHRVLLMLTIGVLGLLLGLGSRPDRGDSVFGLLVLLVVVVPVGATVWRMPSAARRILRALPSRRPLLVTTAGLLGAVALLVLCWTVSNALFPGTLSPLSLALVGLAAAGGTAGLNRLTQMT